MILEQIFQECEDIVEIHTHWKFHEHDKGHESLKVSLVS